jgi:hypothetical protein
MRKRASVEVVGTALLAALGLLGGCGGGVMATGDGDGRAPGPNGSDAGPSEGLDSGQGDAGDNERDAPPPGQDAHGNPPGACTLHACLNPSPMVVGALDTGYDTCQGGWLRRRAIMDCPSLLPRPSGGACRVADGGGQSGCTSDKDCTSRPNGYCTAECYCNYGCLRDSDCGNAENICVCGDPVGQCEFAYCTSGGGCLPDCDCVSPPPYQNEFTCQTPADTCTASSDCSGTPIPLMQPPGSPGGCGYTGTAVCTSVDYKGELADSGFACRPAIRCVTGRPFLVHGSERLAERAERGDWRSANVAPAVDSCSDSVRARLADYWTRVGLMEHASIAAFARFTLHLLAVGAPPDLVNLSQQAIGDETEHARLAFSLASAYGGASLGPGAIAIDGSLDGFSVTDFLATLLREGCIGETIAAIEARDAQEDTQDSLVRKVLETIARDELRHAELAWRTLGWLVVSGRVSRAAVRHGMVQALAEMKSSPVRSATIDDLGTFGVVSDGRRDELRRAAATQVIGRCAEALLRRDRPTGRVPARAIA